MPSVVEELKEVHRGPIEHLPEDDDADDPQHAWRNELEGHPEREERSGNEGGEAVADVDVVPKGAVADCAAADNDR